MLQGLKDFFAKVTADQTLQERLSATKEVADVAIIAKELGFNVTGAEILRAQAGRIMLLSQQEMEDAAAGMKPKTGAHWGRAGKGWLDNAGFWVHKLIQWDCTQPANEQQLEAFFTKIKEDKALQDELLHAKTYNDIVSSAHTHGYEISSSTLLRYMATQIVMLDDEKAEQVARGAQ